MLVFYFWTLLSLTPEYFCFSVSPRLGVYCRGIAIREQALCSAPPRSLFTTPAKVAEAGWPGALLARGSHRIRGALNSERRVLLMGTTNVVLQQQRYQNRIVTPASTLDGFNIVGNWESRISNENCHSPRLTASLLSQIIMSILLFFLGRRREHQWWGEGREGRGTAYIQALSDPAVGRKKSNAWAQQE